ncbi:MAG: SCO family protein [Paenibacillaceae bacterium]
MKQYSQHWFKFATLGLLIVIVAAVVIQMNEPSTLKTIKQATDFQLSALDGEQVSLQSTSGKARLIYFFYTSCPDVCYPTTLFMSKVQDILAEKGDFPSQAALISVTFDPKRDTVQTLQSFAAQYHPDFKGWKFLRGDEAAIKDLAYAYGSLVVKDEKGNFVTHSNTLALIDKKGFIRNYYNASDIKLTPKMIAADMQQLIDEK